MWSGLDWVRWCLNQLWRAQHGIDTVGDLLRLKDLPPLHDRRAVLIRNHLVVSKSASKQMCGGMVVEVSYSLTRLLTHLLVRDQHLLVGLDGKPQVSPHLYVQVKKVSQ